MKSNEIKANRNKLRESHPCFGNHPATTGRIHLPVSAGCNIGCRFCERSINCHEQRPGVTAEVLSPEEALRLTDEAVVNSPNLKVAGIAGPGDPLATDCAIETFALIKEKYPQLLRCLSTNGLLLPEKASKLIEIGINSLTVTVNAVDPEIEAKLNDFIVYHGERYIGTKAAEILIKNQLAGIRIMADAGAVIKVNTVLVPGINDHHIAKIAETVSGAGAALYNIIPLIPQNKLKDVPAPACRDLESARLAAGKYIEVFRHCQHCRADAIGIPGKSDDREIIYSLVKKTSRVRDTFSHG